MKLQFAGVVAAACGSSESSDRESERERRRVLGRIELPVAYCLT